MCRPPAVLLEREPSINCYFDDIGLHCQGKSGNECKRVGIALMEEPVKILSNTTCQVSIDSFRQWLVLFVFLSFFPVSGVACEDWVAKVVAVEGFVQRQSLDQEWQYLQRDQTICPGESVRVGSNSRAALHLRNNTFSRLDANSLIAFPHQTTETRFWIQLQKGIAHFISRIVNSFEVATPYVNAMVEGTEFIVSADQQAAVTVVEGKVNAYNDADHVQLIAGQQARSVGKQKDLARFNVSSSTVVEWAIYYPPVLTLAELSADNARDQALLDSAIQSLKQNRIDTALATLNVESPSNSLRVAKAALLLQIGQLQAFEQTLLPALGSELGGLAYSLKTIAGVGRNDISLALKDGEKAVQLAPGQSASWVALSYAQQADLQMDAAMISARKATSVNPESVLGQLRLSELFLAQGDIAGAATALEQVEGAAADSAIVMGAKGFVELFRLKLNKARERFEAALNQDSANPQYHLGLGLALLRDGDLGAGRRELEYAVSLDPLRSVLRSYMGRAYFEEKRDKEAIKQWALAKQFDPNDPTPYFYAGVYKLFANDPVGAIDELETSRDLNDKRALYRSETLLQSDAASRSATLARAYDEVGYDQGVLLNGWDAVQRDPANSEGHRLLADYYRNDPRYETARLSELLQSQVWQPLSAFPLQPQLSEANLAVVAGAGPQVPGLNEFHSLFTRDGAYGALNAYGGSDSTLGNDLVGSLIAGPFAVNLGQYHFESEGWRKDAGQTQNLFNGLVQWQMTPFTQIQIEYRKLNWNRDDLTPRWSDKQTRFLYDDQERETQRISVTHRVDRRNAFVVSYMQQQFDNQQSQDLPANVGVGELDQKPVSVEFQGLYSGYAFRTLYGLSSSRVDIDSSFSTSLATYDDTFYPTDIGVDIFSAEGRQQKQDDWYSYVYLNPLNALTLQLGLTYSDMEIKGNSRIRTVTTTDIPILMLSDVTEESFVDSSHDNQSRWSPKLGMTLTIPGGISMRMAAFKAISKVVAAAQTLEPVTVAGFNQYYGDVDGLQSRNFGLAIDYAGLTAMKAGVSYVRRLLEGNTIFNAVETAETRANEKIASIYSYFQLSPRWVLLASSQYATLEDAYFKQVIDGISSARNLSVPLELKWFSEAGFTTSLKYTYYNSRFEFNDSFSDTTEVRQHSNVVDLKLSYRLPRRIGLLDVGVSNATNETTELLYYKGSGDSVLGYYPSRMGYCRLSVNF